jgi:hypothetical protein
MKHLFLIFTLFAFEALADSPLGTKELRDKAIQGTPRIENALLPICSQNEMLSHLCQLTKEECERLAVANPNIAVSLCAARNVISVMSIFEFCNGSSACATQQSNSSEVFSNMAQFPNYAAGYALCEPIHRLKSRNEALNNLKNELSAINPLMAHTYDYTSFVNCIIVASK